jgi:peptidoglycan/LPS O-acetylase OafA/YrhL
MLYTFGVMGLIALSTPTRPVPQLVGFLSAASLGLYLYHAMFQVPLHPLVHAWPPPLRILAVAGGGLLGAALLCRLGMAVLGQRARMVLGA